MGDTVSDDRWSVWAAQLAELGLRSVLAIPIRVGDEMLGVLNVVAAKPYAFEPRDVAIAHLLARHASVAVASARQEDTLQRAVDARGVVGQALGILMERFSVDADRAFLILRRSSGPGESHPRALTE
ncbi:GAF and ANTAR domain-containing protein [Kribbella qitaiheensis]|uniref:GAF and ANTAR domain-containing protein n=1 Tax=Kribbella qitaiheensis TaxID=1544730 RepID=UPI001FEAC041|nr:GAF and ANTAR domain-containing protein [Kribbella qitaiheensis]